MTPLHLPAGAILLSSLGVLAAWGISFALNASEFFPSAGRPPITLFLCGDVMTGRGIDQVLPHPSAPLLFESYMRDARGYVELAERVNGPIRRPVSFPYIWGDALTELERAAPEVRIINLETSVTTSDDCWPGKGIHYRMHPANVPCITAARIDCCVLANNHVLDWGYAGLLETLTVLRQAGLKTAGAGRDRREAEAPAIVEVKQKGRVVVFSCGVGTSGIPSAWAAHDDRPGVNRLADLSDRVVERIAQQVRAVKRPRDVVVVSIHWGGNWGYEIPPPHRRFAHQLIEKAGVDIIHGHSSHHAIGIEVYQGRLILYGCGDFLNDYEGIGGYQEYRPDLTLMYFVDVEPATGTLVRLRMAPMQVRRLQVKRASRADTLWLQATLSREGSKLGTQVACSEEDGSLFLLWE